MQVSYRWLFVAVASTVLGGCISIGDHQKFVLSAEIKQLSYAKLLSEEGLCGTEFQTAVDNRIKEKQDLLKNKKLEQDDSGRK